MAGNPRRRSNVSALAQPLDHLQGHTAAIHYVKVECPDAVIHQFRDLSVAPVDADFMDGGIVSVGLFQGSLQLRRDVLAKPMFLTG